MALLVGDPGPIRALRERLQFALVVGIPRTGGKYLTKALLRTTGHEPTTVPAVLAHDGVPDAGPWRFDRHGNGWVESLHSMAEYLTMAEAFFGTGAGARDARPAIVPKKATKLALRGRPPRLGARAGRRRGAHRAPPGADLPVHGRDRWRSSGGRSLRGAEQHRALLCPRRDGRGLQCDHLAAVPYFDVYLRYWEAYHLRLATSAGVVRPFRIVAYGAERYAALSGELAAALGAEPATPSPSSPPTSGTRIPPGWRGPQPVIDRVADRWERVGLRSRAADVSEAL